MMRHQTHSLALGLTLAIVGAGLPGSLSAQGPVPPGPMTFADLDKNGDGQLSPEEFAAGQQARMQGPPGMGPGGGMGPGAGMGPGGGMGPGMGGGPGMGRNMPTFVEFDLNADGTLTETEFYEARAKRMAQRAAQGYPMRNVGKAPPFSAFDTDGNGKVTPEEFAAAMALHRAQMMSQP